MNILLLDTETTDLNSDARLVQLAYKNLTTGKVVNEFFKPAKPISFGSMAVHHVTNEMVADKPLFIGGQHQLDLVDELVDSIMVAHNASYDISILKNEGIEVKNYLDTLRLARHLIDSEDYKLQYLRYMLNLNVVGAPHDALGDIIVLEALFKNLQGLVKEKFSLVSEEEVVGKLQELNQMPVLLKTVNFGKYKGKTWEEVGEMDQGYLQWLYNSESQKPVADQDVEKLYTLKHYISSLF